MSSRAARMREDLMGSPLQEHSMSNKMIKTGIDGDNRVGRVVPKIERSLRRVGKAPSALEKQKMRGNLE